MIGRFGDVDSAALLSEIRQLIGDVPENIGFPEQLLVRNLAGRMLGRIATREPDVERSAMAAAFIDFIASPAIGAEWRHELLRLVDRCATTIASVNTPATPPLNRSQVCQVLAAIETRYARSDLTLERLAREANLSVCHLSRMLNDQTGRGFVDQLHDRRIVVARSLLTTSNLTVKEVAGAVGYRSVTQLERHYKKRFDATPVSARRIVEPLSNGRL